MLISPLESFSVFFCHANKLEGKDSPTFFGILYRSPPPKKTSDYITGTSRWFNGSFGYCKICILSQMIRDGPPLFQLHHSFEELRQSHSFVCEAVSRYGLSSCQCGVDVGLISLISLKGQGINVVENVWYWNILIIYKLLVSWNIMHWLLQCLWCWNILIISRHTLLLFVGFTASLGLLL